MERSLIFTGYHRFSVIPTEIWQLLKSCQICLIFHFSYFSVVPTPSLLFRPKVAEFYKIGSDSPLRSE